MLTGYGAVTVLGIQSQVYIPLHLDSHAALMRHVSFLYFFFVSSKLDFLLVLWILYIPRHPATSPELGGAKDGISSAAWGSEKQ
jgi:hypothetical protein